MKVRFLYGYLQFCNVDCRVNISLKWNLYSIISAKCNIEPPNVTNANIELISGRLVGDVVYYKCAPGYETDFTITCLSNRQWSATKSCLSKFIICIIIIKYTLFGINVPKGAFKALMTVSYHTHLFTAAL